jgi:hypothetical protein
MYALMRQILFGASEIKFKNYTVHASKKEPQYLIQSDKTDHLAMHKGSALTLVARNKT